MGTLDGRSVVVTGASSGIGEAVARRLVAAWLASDAATFVSGSLFTIDGGLTAQSPIGG